jgi:hypothetical protein
MGLLDDAIREHLDLKRRRGADPAEVERAEQEALGPVRRQPQGAEDLPIDQPLGTGADDELVYEDELEQAWEQERNGEPLEPASPALPHGYAPGPATDPAEELGWAPTEEPYTEDEPLTEPSGAPDTAPPEPERAFPRPHAAPHAGEETAEYEVEFEHEPGQGKDDVLEETPEFLQDAPDHDRLWFEQRPPRDFNFDS